MQQMAVRVAWRRYGGGEETAGIEAYGGDGCLGWVLGVEDVAAARLGVVAVDARLVRRGARVVGRVGAGIVGVVAVSAAATGTPLLHRHTAVAGVARGDGGAERVRRWARRPGVGVAVLGHWGGVEDGVLMEVAAALVEMVWQRFTGLGGVVARGVDG